MKHKLLIYILFFICVIQQLTVQACERPFLPFRILVKSADLIVGAQLSKTSTQTQGELVIDRTIKGNEPSSVFKTDPPFSWITSYDELESGYIIAFLEKDRNGGYRSLFADHSILHFPSAKAAEYAISRFQELIAIQRRYKDDELTQHELDWLIQSIEVGQQKIPFYGYLLSVSRVSRGDWIYDALYDLNNWYLPAEEEQWETIILDAGDSWRYFDQSKLELITKTQRDRILKQFLKTEVPYQYFAKLVHRLELRNIEDHLLEALYLSLDLEDDSNIHTYLDVLTARPLTTQQQNFLAKLILFYYKAMLKKDFEEGKRYRWLLEDSYRPFLSDYVSTHDMYDRVQAWKEHTETVDYLDVRLFSSLIEEAAQYINMCDDWRISKLSGRYGLWKCAEESAFAQVKSFDEGSIDVQLFPNPSNGNFNIQLILEDNSPVFVEVLTVAGKSLAQQQLTAKEGLQFHFKGKFELEGLPSGVYFVQVRQKNRVYVQKILVE